MILYPAIDLKDGKCVRLIQGDYNQVTTYGDPVAMARRWESEGAKYLHLVDLNGAKTGALINEQVIKDIIANINIPVELGGGIRSLNDIDKVLSLGVDRVILGSVAVKDIEVVKEAIAKYGNDKIVVGVDAKDFKVAIGGWLEVTSLDALSFCKILEDVGVKIIIFTDIARDGMLSGFNIEQTKTLINNTNLQIIASGGIRDSKDLDVALEIGCQGAVLGKSLYAGKINLKEIIEKY